MKVESVAHNSIGEFKSRHILRCGILRRILDLKMLPQYTLDVILTQV